jgi:hypothetical protein
MSDRDATDIPAGSRDEPDEARKRPALNAIAVVWAATSKIPAERVRIGKAWAPEGKWPVTDGVQRLKYFFEFVTYPSLDDLAADISRRIAEGTWTMVTGAPRPSLDLTKLHARNGKNFIDAPTVLFVTDFDGMTPDEGKDLSTPEAFGVAIVDTLRSRLDAAGLHALSKAKLVLVTTASTGMALNSLGMPANGCARFRAIFEFDRPLTLKQQKTLVEKMGSLPSFKCLNAVGKATNDPCLDAQIKTHGYNIFVNRALMPKGMVDPIDEPVWVVQGRERVDPDVLARELGLARFAEEPPDEPVASVDNSPEETARRLRLRQMNVPLDKREPLLSALVKTLPNECKSKGDRRKWIGVGHAIWGACGGESYGFDIWSEWCARWKFIDVPAANKEAWPTLGEEGDNGIDYLMGWAVEVGTPEALAAVEAIELAAFPVIDNEDAPGGPEDVENEESDDDLLARRMPAIDPKAFYGPLARIVEATTARSEATKVGVAAQIMAHTSCAMRPFYHPMGNDRSAFNIYVIQVGPSGLGRKGTSAGIADNYLNPAIMRQALLQSTRLMFADTDEITRREAEGKVAEAGHKLVWVKNVSEFEGYEIENELDKLRDEGATLAKKIVDTRNLLRAKVRSPRTQQAYEKSIGEAEGKTAGLVARIAENEAYLAEVQRVLADQPAAMAEAQAAHDAAVEALNALPVAGAPPKPWVKLFALLAEGPVTARGINTGEGMVQLIRDSGITQGARGPIVDPGVANKVLFINLEEFGGMLSVMSRSGSTLSTMARTAFDCKPLELLNKNSPTRCMEPYVVISAGVTPAELMGKLFDKRDAAVSADNGFGNRFFYVWVKRARLEDDPQATPGLDAMMDEIAANILKVYETLEPEGPFMAAVIGFTPDARKYHKRRYTPLANRRGAGPNADKLVQRLTIYLRRIAGVLAVMNGEHEISVGALEAAFAWVDYAAATIDAIAATAADRKKTHALTSDGETVLAALTDLGGDRTSVPTRNILRKTRMDKTRLDAAITSLLRMGPSPITLTEEDYVSGNGTKQRRAVLSLATAIAPHEPTEEDPF